jgi:methionyl-tRNA formyltransferase
MEIKLVFFGTSTFSATVLQRLLENPAFSIAAVVTATDKPAGRKQEMQESAVAKTAAKYSFPVLKPKTLKDGAIFQELKKLSADLFLVAAYGKIIPKNILDLPKLGPINIHGSLLPEYRGASPLHAAILDGRSKTGITIMRMDEQMDHGEMLIKHELPIAPDQTEPELEKDMAELAAEHIAEDLLLISSGKVYPEVQDHSKATLTKIINKEDGLIDWSKSASKIYNQFRAYSAWPGIYTFFNVKRLKIISCKPSQAETEDRVPGKVFKRNDRIFISCGQGAIELLDLQLEGKNVAIVKDFILGHKDFVGAELK